jgi:hypothetical protein
MSYDPRLAPVLDDKRAIDREAVERLLCEHPTRLALPEIEALHVLFFEIEIREPHALYGVTYTRPWFDAFMKVVGCTVARETLRHGKTVTRSVRRYRAKLRTNPTRSPAGRTRTRTREHRPASTRRTSSSSSTSSADPGDPEPAASTGGHREAVVA